MHDVICNEAVPFRPYCAGVATGTRNVSEYMLVLALCLVVVVCVVSSYNIQLANAPAGMEMTVIEGRFHRPVGTAYESTSTTADRWLSPPHRRCSESINSAPCCNA